MENVSMVSDERRCMVCLSLGRTLTPLGPYKHFFMQIISEHALTFQCMEEVCWECLALLRKVALFKQRVDLAQQLLIGQCQIFGSLTNLTSVTFNDTHHIVYLYEDTKSEDTNEADDDINLDKSLNINTGNSRYERNDNLCVGTELNDELDGFYDSIELNDASVDSHDKSVIDLDVSNYKVICNYVRDKEIKACSKNNTLNDYNNGETIKRHLLSDKRLNSDYKNDDKHIRNKCQRSRWALKRLEQNKKPKFEIVSTDFNTDVLEVNITHNDLTKCIADEKDNEYYKDGRFKCKICSLKFHESERLVDHENSSHPEHVIGRHTCDICGDKTSDKRHLLHHIAKHYVGYRCRICQFICRSESHMSWHLQREHKKVFRCLKCRLNFCNRREFFKHFKGWHEKFVCHHCGITFKQRYCIEDHIRKNHSPIICHLCNKTFARYNGLWLHKKLAHSAPTPPAYCVECDKNFVDEYRYKWHLCNSVKHRPRKKIKVPCPECEKTFAKKTYMNEHYNLVHLKLTKHKCEICDKIYIRNADLVKHKRRIHEGILPPKDKICNVCGRGFTTKQILYKHMSRTHVRVKHGGDAGQNLIK